MLKITKPSRNRVDIELTGALGAQAMQEGLDQLVSASEGVEKGRMLYRIRDFEMPSMGAIGVELRQMPRLFGLVGKFERCAVLCDTAWIRTMAEIEGAAIPFLTIKSFPLSAEAEAERWLMGDDARQGAEAEENFPV